MRTSVVHVHAFVNTARNQTASEMELDFISICIVTQRGAFRAHTHTEMLHIYSGNYARWPCLQMIWKSPRDLDFSFPFLATYSLRVLIPIYWFEQRAKWLRERVTIQTVITPFNDKQRRTLSWTAKIRCNANTLAICGCCHLIMMGYYHFHLSSSQLSPINCLISAMNDFSSFIYS